MPTYVVRKPPDDGSADENGGCAKGKCFQNVCASPNTSVHKHFAPSTHRLHNLTPKTSRERVQRCTKIRYCVRGLQLMSGAKILKGALGVSSFILKGSKTHMDTSEC